LVESVAEENHTRDVTANAVLPSIIDTAANRTAMPKAKHDMWPKPEQIAEVIQFLASPASGLVSGAAIPVYGKA
jgi:NAD(P)-dependent dehydrogenase (short-subunit alcohol dehydrogenase family)